MREIASILQAWRRTDFTLEKMLLATVVDVTGSAYRRAGARMLIRSDGGRVGSVSGGCLEADVILKGWWRTEGHQASVLTYDTQGDADAIRELGLGCNGRVRILLERVNSLDATDMLRFLDTCESGREPAVVATVISAPDDASVAVGARLLLTGAELSGSLTRTRFGAAAKAFARDALAAGKSRVVVIPSEGGPVEVFVEAISPALPLVIFGGGHDALPLVQAAKHLGWHVTVADARPSYAQQHRFPMADAVVLTEPGDLFKGVKFGGETVAVVMNHSYAVDREILSGLLRLGTGYVGLLGPRARAQQMLAELDISDAPDCLHAPVGLDIGADTPEGISLSIVAEIQAAVAGRRGGMLRERMAPIYSAEPIADYAVARSQMTVAA